MKHFSFLTADPKLKLKVTKADVVYAAILQKAWFLKHVTIVGSYHDKEDEFRIQYGDIYFRAAGNELYKIFLDRSDPDNQEWVIFSKKENQRYFLDPGFMYRGYLEIGKPFVCEYFTSEAVEEIVIVFKRRLSQFDNLQESKLVQDFYL